MSRSSARIYNVITGIFLLLTVAVVGVFAYLFATVNPEDRQPVIALATRIIIPTETPTDTATPTDTPTATETPTQTLTTTATFTPVPTDTAVPTDTLTPTMTPTSTVTWTPTITMTPTDTPTATPTPTPTGPSATPTPTDSPFLFGIRGEIEFRPNVTNVAGCAWQSVSGRVLNIDGTSSERRYIVRVFNDGFGQVVETGTNSFFDPLSGWEIQVSNIINDLTYFVRLESLGGTVISPDIQVTFPQDCNGNVAFVEFAQVRSN